MRSPHTQPEKPTPRKFTNLDIFLHAIFLFNGPISLLIILLSTHNQPTAWLVTLMLVLSSIGSLAAVRFSVYPAPVPAPIRKAGRAKKKIVSKDRERREEKRY